MMPSLLLKSATDPFTNYTGGLLSGWKKTFHNRIPVYFEKGDYVVKTVSNRREFLQVLKLRYEVFHKEYKSKKFPIGFDKDFHDQFSDHLIIVDQKFNRVVGTYRLMCSTVTDQFYSKSEFQIDDFIAIEGTKVELSRACIHKDHRTGTVISLLWRGLVSYIQQAKAKYLFGLASVKTTDPITAVKLMKYFGENKFASDQFMVKSLPAYEVAKLDLLLKNLTVDETVAELVPPLVKSYLRAGAKIYGDPSIDRDFNCVDYFMILDLTRMNELFDRKFKVN